MQGIFTSVEKPFRYIGGEVGACRKNWDDAAVRICLAFPDAYEIGMSNTGLSILYHIVNNQPHMLAERVFTPWLDMEEKLKKQEIPLFSLESKKPIREFDVLGISLPYELAYTNILTILSLAQIPWRSKDRDDSYPLVIAGGPSAFNPEPVADFFDAIVIGDGERALIEIMELSLRAKRSNLTRNNFLNKLSEIEGIYIPSFEKDRKIKKAIIKNLEDTPYPVAPIVPYVAVHDRVGIEVARGCTRGCRFCQAGFIYRPVRFRSPQRATELALCQLENSGHEDLSFLSLSLGDYPCLNELLKSVNNYWNGPPINSQFPSLRVESLSEETLQLLGKARHGSFTLAPEAATERMRAVVNKGNTDEDLYASVEKVFKAGWHQVKLYFMIGLPNETQEELDGIVKMANRCLDIGKKYHSRAEVTVSTSTFIPKAHTPLQWAKQISIKETLEKQAYLKRNLRRRGLFYRWHDAKMSFLEGVFSRGDRRLSQVVEEAHRLGARFDAWDEKFNFSIWEKAFANVAIDPHKYLEARDRNAKFPWDHLYAELKHEFLRKEYERSLTGAPTPDCSLKECQGCGVCNKSDGLRSRSVEGPASFAPYGAQTRLTSQQLRHNIHGGSCFRDTPQPPSSSAIRFDTHIYRIQLTKTGPAAFLGHLEFANVIRRALRRAGLALCYSEGFHPHAKVSFGKALPVGIESECEFCDVELNAEIDPSEIRDRLVFPDGITVVSIETISQATTSIEQSVATTTYEIFPHKEEHIHAGISHFNAAFNWPFVRRRGEKTANVDLKHYITGLVVDDKGVIGMTLAEREPMIRVSEALEGIFGLGEFKDFLIKKVSVIYT